jgi:homoserine dehydrogenase
MDKTLKVVVAGLGTVGSGVVSVLTEHAQRQSPVQLAGVLEKDLQGPNARPWAEAHPEWFQRSAEELLEDPEVDVIVETIGGRGFAKDLISAALRAGKHVVTANKDLIATDGKDLIALAQAQGRHLLFEAAVAGAIPVLRLLQNYFQNEDVQGLRGILNGTSNYILSQMETERLSFEKALSQAQELGFAEQDPTNDIAGYDARYKLVILTYLLTGQWLAPEQIPLEGIDHLDLADFEYAERMGRRIKLIASFERDASGISTYVMPLMLDREEPMAGIHGSTNVVTLKGRFSEDITLVGKGAGSLPTASAIVADLYKILGGYESASVSGAPVPLRPFEERSFRHTLRFEVWDAPGIVGKIGSMLAEEHINIYALEQLPQYHRMDRQNREAVIFTMSLETCPEGVLQNALKRINQEPFMVHPAVVLREPV